ncbi:TonB-dependent receptor plug domain-containing protein [Winogradskyella luteola]|uniref:TonB-dependent receptor n=1 Tax=Winogradskyella luteola TaxID=2828330 RepID=A0A9X1F597_9FLAO|nr:TonB-dependent receptor [Winogradskyella luteola]MBV7267646.1 TonB-dependent receptor [Winogradskyella luteola]
MKHIFILFFLISPFVVVSQTLDSIQNLDEVVLRADRLLKTFSKTQTTQVLSDSIIKRNTSSLTQLLNFNSPVYFKENGLGMVSSPSFRGTTAQQTAVIWNGININSQFNGQTDFSTINTRNFDEITIRHGGGSVLYGSGAIGGSIHLSDKVDFNMPFENNLFAGFGSFNTQDLSYGTRYADDKFSVGFTVTYTHSDNDYDYLDSDRKNLNGQFYNVGLSTTLGYKIDQKNILRYYNHVFDGERHFSLILPTEIRTKYRDFNTRQLLEWEGRYGKFLSVLRAAYLTESYKYFGNIENDNFTFAEAETFIGNYQLSYKWADNAKAMAVADINYTNGEGSSIVEASRTISAFSVLLNQRIKSFYYEATVRKEVTNTYESPLLFSLGVKQQFGDFYTVNVNGSKNFRIPTYNDLYWANAGNPNLSPETSHQIELGNQFNFKNGLFSLTGFYYDIENMIRWVPNTSGVWRPINTDNVVSYGLESRLQYSRQFKGHQLQLNANYAYTISENQFDNKQLIYVPYHKGSGSFNYAYNKLSVYWQTAYVGEVFIQSDNDPNRVVAPFWVHNLGLEYKPLDQCTLGFRIQNLFNKNYQSVANRYMPGINYNIYLTFNF